MAARSIPSRKPRAEKKCQRWIKLHAQVGTITNVIASVEATESTVGDALMLEPLLASSLERGFNVKELSADKAYLSNDILTAIESAGAVPYIPFKSNSRGTGKSDAWPRLWHTFSARNDEFLAHYHKRSNVGTTFSSMMKRKFGASVRAKAFPAQVNEVLLKCLCHNLSVLVHSIQRAGHRTLVLVAHGGRVAMPRRALSLDEQKNVRAYLQMMRVRFGNWRTVERALPVSHSVLNDILQGRSEVSVTVAFRIAKMLDVSLHHVLTGTALPPGICKHCGRAND